MPPTLELHTITFDCHDALALGTFWSRVLGHPLAEDSAEEAALLRLPHRPSLLFLRVPEGKTTKNRLHLDLAAPPGSNREAETRRVLALGARLLQDLRNPDGTGWAVLADPEGNEFCVVLADHER
ncbi:VOC family protein [Nocardiopsis algeriensis]|uniref:VOC family protein n=1 Tax=Nocardiopsis algeriensis TaxID=1478215 RepID=UPI003B43338B